MEYYIEVLVQGEWCGNQLTFKTREDAEEYARDLMMRWTLVEEWRVCKK